MNMNMNRNAYAPLENPIPSYRRTDKAKEQGFDNSNLSNNNAMSNKQNLYNHVETIEAQIINITQFQVILKCLLDKKTRTFQTRKFDKIPFEGLVDLKPNNFVKITIYTRPGERKFVYQNMYASDELKELFEPINYFEGLEDSPFFKSIQQD